MDLLNMNRRYCSLSVLSLVLLVMVDDRMWADARQVEK